jgi:hypothetical protein
MDKNIYINYQKKYNDIKLYIKKNQIEKYIMWGIFFLTIITLFIKIIIDYLYEYGKAHTYIQYYL